MQDCKRFVKERSISSDLCSFETSFDFGTACLRSGRTDQGLQICLADEAFLSSLLTFAPKGCWNARNDA